MANEFYIKQNDTAPSIQEILSLNGTVIDLTGCTVRFHMKVLDGVIKIDQPATVVDAVNGIVQYDWDAGDTDTVDNFFREWEITLPSGRIMTVPNDTLGYSVIITAELA